MSERSFICGGILWIHVNIFSILPNAFFSNGVWPALPHAILPVLLALLMVHCMCIFLTRRTCFWPLSNGICPLSCRLFNQSKREHNPYVRALKLLVRRQCATMQNSFPLVHHSLPIQLSL